MKRYNFINGQVFDARFNSLEKLNIAVAGRKVIGLGYLPDEKDEDYDVIDITGCVVVPNITDALVFQSYDTLSELSEIGLNAGVTGIGLYPEKPLKMETPEHIALVLQKASAESKINIYPIGSLTKKASPHLKHDYAMAELDLMKNEGAVAFIDTISIESTIQMRNILTYSSLTGKTIIIRSLDQEISNGGLMNEGYNSTILGLKTSHSIAEELRIARDIQLLEAFGGKLHFSTVTTAKSVELVRHAKKKGLPVTCGTAPHYLYFTDKEIDGYNTYLKVNPPLRSEVDRCALIDGIKDGTIDVIASHHRPATLDEKRVDFESAAPGISSLDLLLPLLITKLYHEENMKLEDILPLISSNVHTLFSIKPKGIALTNTPTFSVIDLNTKVLVTEEQLMSKGKNNPFIGKELTGFSKMTMSQGILFN